ncbi:hypothetical protein Clacol_009954 [Clathrus columnatus]|uniref:DUF6533 domain-containing protein n=1 Tax=Clathrus columnatus TaxID=1419009 RepID=A0AAV5AM03_9AGAM|nr:hypothetical protein Clacol_009954 [Clathrus columnatus]
MSITLPVAHSATVPSLEHLCTILIHIPPALAIFQTASIMILRIYALYERNKRVMIALLLLLGGQVIAMAILANNIQFSMGPHGCMALKGGDYISMYYTETYFAKADLKLIGVSLGVSVSATITSRLVLNLHDTQPNREADQTEQDGVLTTIPPIYVTPPDLDTYSLHDVPHHDNNSWYTNETSDVEARKNGIDQLVLETHFMMESVEMAFRLQMMHYIVLVPTIALYYDHILTFGREVEWIWKRKLTIPTGLFLFIRYSTTFWEVSFITLLFNIHSLPDFNFDSNATNIIITLLVTLNVTVVAGTATDGSSRTLKLPECKADMDGDLITLFWWFPLGFDTLVFTLTFLEINRLRKRITPDSSPLLKLLTRDGLIFYVVICFLNLLNIWSYFFLPPELKSVTISFSLNLTTTMVSRLVLNIQDVSQQMIGRFSQRSTPDSASNQDDSTDVGVLTTAPSIFIESRILMAWDSFHDLHRVNVNHHDQTTGGDSEQHLPSWDP